MGGLDRTCIASQSPLHVYRSRKLLRVIFYPIDVVLSNAGGDGLKDNNNMISGHGIGEDMTRNKSNV